MNYTTELQAAAKAKDHAAIQRIYAAMAEDGLIRPANDESRASEWDAAKEPEQAKEGPLVLGAGFFLRERM